MQKKSKKKLIMTVIAAVLILPLLLFAVFLWYLPQYWFNKLQNEYLLQNRHVLRTEKVQAGAFNKFILSGVQLGSGKKTLFTAPRAELLLNTNFAGKLDCVPVKGLILYDTRTRIDCKRRKIYINGILLEKFVRELQKLPMSVDGKKLELEIYSQLALGSNNPASDLHLKVKVFDDKLNIFGSWRSSADSKYSGSWRAVIDLSHDEWAVTLDKYISEIFMQEILLRSGVPAKATALLNKAMICGNGSFSGSFRDLQIKEFTYSGKVESPAISFYKHRINNIAPFEIELKKNTDNIVCRIPQLDLPGRQSTQIRNINISYRKKINFSAECNLQKLVSNNFCKNSNFAVKTIFSADDRVSGSWDPATDQWQFNRNISSTLPGTMTWEVKGATVSLKPEKIEVEAEGKGSAGTLKQKISFKEVLKA